MCEIHVFNKILRGRHFSEEKGKDEAIKDNFDFILRLINSMSDITNNYTSLYPKYACQRFLFAKSCEN